MIVEIGPHPRPEVLDFLREVVSDERISDLRHVSVLADLRRAEGPGRLRALRDDE